MRSILRRKNPRIVIPMVSGIGNALMAVPMVRQLKHAIPKSRVMVMARTAAMAEVFQRLREVDEVRLMHRGSFGMARSMIELQLDARPDLFLIPFPSNRWQYITLALGSGASKRLLHSYPVGCLSALGLVPADRVSAIRGIHDVVQNLNLLTKLGIQPDVTEPPQFNVTDSDLGRAGDMLVAAGLPGDVRPIAIHPGSAQTILANAKRWPAENYAHLLLRLLGQFGNRVMILEGPDEPGVGAEILYHAAPVKAPVIRLSGPLGDAAAILQRSVLYIGSDSGLAHLSAAVGTPPITLFAPSDPNRVCPFGYRHLVAQPRGLSCVPCFMYPWQSTRPKLRCQDARCIREITVEQVMCAVEKVPVAR